VRPALAGFVSLVVATMLALLRAIAASKTWS
jgi:hypothetical protein